MTSEPANTAPRRAGSAPLPVGAAPVLDVRGLTIDLDIGGRSVPVVTDVSFSVGAGQILGVVGESGSGKSITALSVLGMLPPAARVREGSITYNGRELLGRSESEMRALRGRELGMVFQDPLAYLNPLMTVGQQIREALTLHGASGAQADRRTVELLELVGVREPQRRAKEYPHQFSGGMRQRVIIAIAVANDPKLLVADEPTTALDVTVQAGILDLLGRLRDELGTALLLITHDVGIVEQVCDSVMVMYAGQVAERGRADDVLARPDHPYTRELMRSTPRLDLPQTTRLATIPGQPPDVANRPSGCPFHPRCPEALDQCRQEDPPLTLRRPGHHAACWVPLDTARPSAGPPAAQDAVPVTADTVLELSKISASYQQRRRRRGPAAVPVVAEVDLTLRRGEILGLVGESGSGKSTVARAVLGMLPLTSGTIRVAGMEWAGADAAQRLVLRRTVQMVFQDPYLSLDQRQTIREALEEPLTVHRLVEPGRRADRVDELLALVGLPRSVLGRYPYQLSGGQRQRVGIARALAMKPQVLVADEPVSALDVSVQAQVINLLADLRAELGLACLVIAHDLSVVRHLCDRVAVMYAGRIVEQGTAAGVFANPQHEYTRTLLESVPRRDPKAPLLPTGPITCAPRDGERAL